MSRGPDPRLAGLSRITRMMLDAELAKLSELTGEVAVRRATLDRLTAQKATRAAAVAATGNTPDLALATGRDALWTAWLEARRADAARALAQAAARAEAQRLVTSRAFGRNLALDRIREAQAEERRLDAVRRGAAGTADGWQ